jgi:cyclin-dependent kinase 7
MCLPPPPPPVNLAVDLRRLAELRTEQAVRDYKELARDMRMTSDEDEALKRRRLQLDLKHDMPASCLLALKKIMLKEANSTGVSMDAIREIKVLQELDHPNVLKIRDVYQMDSNVNVVLEYMRGDLAKVVESRDLHLQPADIKSYMHMLLSGVDHCHRSFCLHRDIKPQNCLLALDGTLKLADFGLARPIASPDRDMTPRVCTLWYRAPELLFTARSYGAATDMWAVGCVFAQLILRRPLFSTKSDSELEQLHVITQALGAPTEENWRGCSLLPGYFEQSQAPALPVIWDTTFAALAPDARDLLRALLALDPRQRPSAETVRGAVLLQRVGACVAMLHALYLHFVFLCFTLDSFAGSRIRIFSQ